MSRPQGEDPFLTRCREDRAVYAEYLASCETGGFRMTTTPIAGGESRDVTADHIEHVRRIIADLDVLIGDYEANP